MPPTQSKWKERLLVTVFALALLLAPLSKDIAAAADADKSSEWKYLGGTENNSKTFIVQQEDAFKFTVDHPGKGCTLKSKQDEFIQFDITYPGNDGTCTSEVRLYMDHVKVQDSDDAAESVIGLFGKSNSINISVSGEETSVATKGASLQTAKTCVPDLKPFDEDASQPGLNLTLTLNNTTKMPEGCSIVLHFDYDKYDLTTPTPTVPPTKQPPQPPQQATTPDDGSMMQRPTEDKPNPPGTASNSTNSTTDGSSGKDDNKDDSKVVFIVIAIVVGLVILCIGCVLGWFAFQCLRAEKIHDEGFDEGLEEGREAGFVDGKKAGFKKGHKAGFDEGHEDGVKEGKGWASEEQMEQYQEGVKEGRIIGKPYWHRRGWQQCVVDNGLTFYVPYKRPHNMKEKDPDPIPLEQFKEIYAPISEDIAD